MRGIRLSMVVLAVGVLTMGVQGWVQAGLLREVPVLRVQLLSEVRAVSIGADDCYEVQGAGGRDQRLDPDEMVRCTAEAGLVVIEGRSWGHRVRVAAVSGAVVRVAQRRYRGGLTIEADHNVLTVINELPLEEYLYGVLKWEISPRWPLPVVAAQAVVARTFALSRYLERGDGGEGYHLRDDNIDQVYGGVEAEGPLVRIAVDLTRGEVLTYRGRPIVACYHACSGGYTASADAVWGVHLPYLKAHADPSSTTSPYAVWQVRIPRQDIEARIQDAYAWVGTVQEVVPGRRDTSGRVTEMEIRHSRGRMWVSGDEFRRIVGYQRLRSTRFEVVRDGSWFQFQGGGWGHGVGMSQWGAKALAEEGQSMEEILAFYYPGTRIQTYY